MEADSPPSHVLILVADDFDEVDFNVTHDGSPDEMVVRPLTRSSHVRQSLSNNVKVEVSPNHQHEINSRRQLEPPSLDVPLDSIGRPLLDSTSNSIQHPNSNPSNTCMLDQQADEGPPKDKNPSLTRLAAQRNHLPHENTAPLLNPERTPQQHNSTVKPMSPSASSATVENDPPIKFFAARAAEAVQNASGTEHQAPSFNPRLESPSIRKTAGIDHSKTKPVGRDSVGAPPTPSVSNVPRSNFVNPQTDKTRRVGMPVGAAASPLSNRSSYKPPQMKRPAEGNALP